MTTDGRNSPNEFPARPDVAETRNTAENFAWWCSRPYIGATLRAELERASVLLVPQEGHREDTTPLFPVGTEELLHYLKGTSRFENAVDICIEEGDYRELALHSGLIILGTFVVTSILAPVFVSVLSEYLKKRILHAQSQQLPGEPQRARAEIIVCESHGIASRAAKITYEGPVDTFQQNMGHLLGQVQIGSNQPAISESGEAFQITSNVVDDDDN